MLSICHNLSDYLIYLLIDLSYLLWAGKVCPRICIYITNSLNSIFHYVSSNALLNLRSSVHTTKPQGETGVSWHMGFVGTLSFSLSANYDFTKEYHLYKGTNNTHTPYGFQSCSTNTVGINQLCLIFHLLSKFFSFQKS